MRYPTCNCFDKYDKSFEPDIEITFRNRDAIGMPDTFIAKARFNYCVLCGKPVVNVWEDEE